MQMVVHDRTSGRMNRKPEPEVGVGQPRNLPSFAERRADSPEYAQASAGEAHLRIARSV